MGKIIKIEGSMVLMLLPGLPEMWIPKAMLKQYGVKASQIKVGAEFKC